MENLGNLPRVRARVHPLCQAVSLFAILPPHLHNLLPRKLWNLSSEMLGRLIKVTELTEWL